MASEEEVGTGKPIVEVLVEELDSHLASHSLCEERTFEFSSFDSTYLEADSASLATPTFQYASWEEVGRKEPLRA